MGLIHKQRVDLQPVKGEGVGLCIALQHADQVENLLFDIDLLSFQSPTDPR